MEQAYKDAQPFKTTRDTHYWGTWLFPDNETAKTFIKTVKPETVMSSDGDGEVTIFREPGDK
jgi:hypothetical protein